MTDIPGIDPSVPPSGTGCVECEAASGWWLHLRRCAQCGHIGCCDTSPSQHATAHATATGTGDPELRARRGVVLGLPGRGDVPARARPGPAGAPSGGSARARPGWPGSGRTGRCTCTRSTRTFHGSGGQENGKTGSDSRRSREMSPSASAGRPSACAGRPSACHCGNSQSACAAGPGTRVSLPCRRFHHVSISRRRSARRSMTASGTADSNGGTSLLGTSTARMPARCAPCTSSYGRSPTNTQPAGSATPIAAIAARTPPDAA